MADDSTANGDPPSPQPEPTPNPPLAVATSTASNSDCSLLLDQARIFLNSPQVRYADLSAKRTFLVEKGLTDPEIGVLLQELPVPAPLVPPRTYPQPPPSNLPNLLVGVFRIASWIAGGSATLLLIYFRFIYPRLAQSLQARLALRTHQRDLLTKLTATVTSLKEEQAATFAVLPQPEPHKDARYGDCKSLDEVVAASEKQRDVPDITLLRCALADLAVQKQKATADEIFQLLETKLPWLKADDDGTVRATQLWQTLSTSPLFAHETVDDIAVWSYVPPPVAPRPKLFSDLDALKDALSARAARSSSPSRPPFAQTLQALGDLTGYISSQTYASFHRIPGVNGSGIGAQLSPEEEDVRREIRALKGLVLNRRTFMPSISRAPTPASAPSTPRSLDGST